MTRTLAVSFLVGLTTLLAGLSAGEPGTRLRVGVTLHPYYSFVSNIAGDYVEVVPLIDTGFNPHNYSPRAADITRAMTLDALVVNGVGHDAFALEIVRAAGREDLPLINANEDVSLLPISGLGAGESRVNPHTFISISTAIQQINTITDGLVELMPERAAEFRASARNYASRLRRMKAATMRQLTDLALLDLRCASVHGSYDYLLAEFGLQVAFVVEPAPGLQPSATQMRRTIDVMRERQIHVLFAEEEFPAAYVETIREATGVSTRFLKHLTSGPYSAESFEEGMRHNLDQLAEALIDAAHAKNGG